MGNGATRWSVVAGLVMVGLVALAGCETQAVMDSEAELVPTPAFARSAAADTELIVTRDSGLQGAGGTAQLLVDGREAARLRPSQQVHLYLPAGDHVVSIANVYGNVQA